MKNYIVTLLTLSISFHTLGMEYTPPSSPATSENEKKITPEKKSVRRLSFPVITDDNASPDKTLSLILNPGNKNTLKNSFSQLNAFSEEKSRVTVATPFGGKELGLKLSSFAKKNLDKKNVSLLAGIGTLKNKDSFSNDVRIHVQPDLHAKVILAQQNADDSDSETKRYYEINSYNFSGNIGNVEVGISGNDKEVFEQLSKILLKYSEKNATSKSSASASPVKHIVKISPAKPTVISTHDTDINQSRAARLEKLRNSANPTDFLLLSTMTLNDQTFIDALRDVQLHRTSAGHSPFGGAIFVDQEALNHPEILQDFIECGIKVFIQKNEKIYPNAVIRKILHAKVFIRYVNGACYLEIGTGNMTDQSNKELNCTICLPQRKAFVQELFEFFNTVAESCDKVEDTTTLEAIVQEYKTRKKEAKERKKQRDKEKRAAEKEKTKKQVKKSKKK